MKTQECPTDPPQTRYVKRRNSSNEQTELCKHFRKDVKLNIEKFKRVFSKLLAKSERNWSVLKKEFYSIIVALKRYRMWLIPSGKFYIYTDHKPLLKLNDKENQEYSGYELCNRAKHI